MYSVLAERGSEQLLPGRQQTVSVDMTPGNTSLLDPGIVLTSHTTN